MKKRIVNMLLVSTVIMGLLVGCGTTNNNQASNVQTTEQDENNKSTGDLGTEGPSETDNGNDVVETNGKVLVVYYSATGHTESVANAIAEESGADVFELVPVDVYTDEDLDWTKDDSRVSVEHDNEDLREVELTSATVENWDSYDTVFIGYPIWWGIAAWPVDNFVKSNDFTGKTVIPFCTASSSGIGESGELLAEMAGTGQWQEGERFQSNASADAVKEWVKGLEY